MRRITALSALLASALLAGCSTVSDSPGLEEESGKVVFVTINPSMTFQKIRGFGVSGAWWPTEAGAWPDSQKRNFARLLFDPVDGIGISVYRYNYGAGADAKPIATDNMATDGRGPSISDPWRRTTGLEVSPGVFDLSLDTGALWFVKAAQEAGVRDIVGFVNSPPARFTSNGMVSGARDGLSNLDPARFRDFAKYLVEITRYLRENGFLINWLSAFNEPDIAWSPSQGQEGSSFSPDQAAELLSALTEELNASGLPVSVAPWEFCGWTKMDSYMNAIRRFPGVMARIRAITFHGYDAEPAAREKNSPVVRELFPEAELWMSEWTELKGDRDTGMESALVLANMIHDDMTVTGVSAWQYWIAVSKYDFRDGLAYTRPGTGGFELTKRFWAMGNYSRFIRPGFVRVNASLSGDVLQVSAYKDGPKLVVVVINRTKSGIAAKFEIADPHSWRAVRALETSETRDLEPVGLPDINRKIVINPRSVITIQFES